MIYTYTYDLFTRQPAIANAPDEYREPTTPVIAGRVPDEYRENAIAARCHLSPDHYTTLMFDIGARFLESFCNRYFINGDEMYRDISQEASFTFWDWWKDEWQRDDYTLLNASMLSPGLPGYEAMKDCLVGDPLFEKQLYYIIFPFL